jgi:hypothetical protein
MAGEGRLQRFFKQHAKDNDVLWRKIKFEGRRGCPDTLLVYEGRVMLVELKNPNKQGKLSRSQTNETNRLKLAGVDVRIINSREEIENAIRFITR